MRKIFYGLGYGDRIYIATKDTNSRLGDLLKILSAWGGSDKQDLEEKWVSFEMPCSKDKDLFRKIISIYAPLEYTTVLELTIANWEEFLTYCKEER